MRKQASEGGWKRFFYSIGFLRNLVVIKWNGPTPKVNWRLFTSSRPNLQRISVLPGQNHLLSSRSCPRSLKKTKSSARLTGLSPGCVHVGLWTLSHWQIMERRILGLKILSSCEDIKTFIPSEQRPICLSELWIWCVFNAILCDGWLGPPTIYLPKVNVNAPEVCSRGNESPGCFWSLGDN